MFPGTRIRALHARTRRRLGLVWYRFRRNSSVEGRWRKRFPELLHTEDYRLAGWLRHAVSMYVQQNGPLSEEAAEYLKGRIPIIPLIAERKGPGEHRRTAASPCTGRFAGPI